MRGSFNGFFMYASKLLLKAEYTLAFFLFYQICGCSKIESVTKPKAL